MRRCLALLCAVMVLTLCGCGGVSNGSREETFHLFYPTGEDADRGGDIISSVAVGWEQEKDEDAEKQARRAVELLLADHPERGYKSPVPGDTQLQECSVSGGVARLDFSENYGQLSGMDLSVADYCITLTLSQIPGIYMVSITVDGQELAYRDKNIFTSDDVLLTSTEDVVRALQVQLYFPNQSGVLTPESRVLTLYEGENQADVLLDALLAGPESEELLPLLPEGFAARAVRQEDGVCYVNLPGEDDRLLPDGEAAQEQILLGIVRSLHSLESVEQVQFLRDSEWQPEFGLVDISRPFEAK